MKLECLKRNRNGAGSKDPLQNDYEIISKRKAWNQNVQFGTSITLP